ncbi:cupredoxin domain-containing protein [Nitrosopumilus ureiphilus]|uniref:cupredoxin domain-containing protein n=1 Tax=Nitrosopumilus ureiphilus TaxID=1470067 RepID=UPI001FE9BA3F|nr:plastocyanin/azurin family copper-binding protein [Nitrosopumilus ureiphilus]
MVSTFLSISVYAEENTWNVFLKPYDGLSKKELFKPIELPISSGDKVTWRNHDSTAHMIVSGVPEHPDYSGEFFSTSVLSPGENFSVNLDFEGYAAYYYFCEIHPWYTGKIFFEDNPNMYQSTLDISYETQNPDTLKINGLVESDLGSTGYEILIFDSKNNLVFQKVDSFKPDATFDEFIDISSYMWSHDKNYVLKLVYGIPSESTTLSLEIPIDGVDDDLKSKSLKVCQNSEPSDFLFEGISLPNWYKKPLCWFSDGFFTQKELSDSIVFFRNQHPQN